MTRVFRALGGLERRGSVAMRLERDEFSLELLIVGYQFPELAEAEDDSNSSCHQTAQPPGRLLTAGCRFESCLSGRNLLIKLFRHPTIIVFYQPPQSRSYRT